MRPTRPGRESASRQSNVRVLRPNQPPVQPATKAHAPDFVYIVLLAALVSIGVVMVFSATAVQSGFTDLRRSLMMISVGLIGFLAGVFVPLKAWRQLTPWLLGLTFLALVALFFLPEQYAPLINGARRWIHIPGLPNIQPSEFAKLAFVLFAAGFLERKGPKMEGGDWLTFLGMLGAFAVVIYKEPDLGTALVLSGTAFCMLMAAGVKGRTLVTLALAGILVVAIAATTKDHQQARLKAWWNPWAEEYARGDGWQVNQSWVAMAKGGWWGVGLGKSTQKLANRLPEHETDFIFAIVSEELGLVRAAGVIWLFGLLAWRGFAIGVRGPDRFSGLVATGITSWIAVQSVLNIGVVTGAVPNTGVPLPFISSGGSSLTALLTAAGLVVGVSRYTRRSGKSSER